MVNKTAQIAQSPRQRSRWTQALALLLVVVPYYGMTIMSHITRDRPLSLNDIIFYTGAIASVALVVLLIILRYLCGERFSDLNLKPARWWQDVLGGIALAVLTLGTLYLLGPIIEQILPREAESGLGNVFDGLAKDPWLLALFVGPLLAIGVAGFEEITRVFVLTRWWKISSGTAWRWLGVLVSVVLFGLAHYYQGPGGMANAAISGFILAVAYMGFGRIWPLIISHYLHDAIQILLFAYLIRNGIM